MNAPASRVSRILHQLQETELPSSIREGAWKAVRTPVDFPSSAKDAEDSRWDFDELRGRLTEIVGGGASAALTSIFGIITHAQKLAEPVVWISGHESMFAPWDAAESGADVEAITVIRVANIFAAMRSADCLLRSGGFGLIVLDIAGGESIPASILGKLVKLAQLHDAAVVCLTFSRRTGDSVLGSLVSMRVQSQRTRLGNGKFSCELTVEKDKRKGPGWSLREVVDGPPGLR